MTILPTDLATDFAAGISAADRRGPRAINARSKEPFQPGIGPHSEAQTIELVGAELSDLKPAVYGGRLAYGVPYPELPKQKCDLCIGAGGTWDWAVEVKMLRVLGDNGKANDNILMHILSPYPSHRSAVTDCLKLVHSKLGQRKAILIYGYEAADWPLEPAIEAFEALASRQVKLGSRERAAFNGLIHPVHAAGQVFVWEIERRS